MRTEGEIFAEKYRLLKLLGRGSYGEVWLAHNILADMTVAVKIYLSQSSQGIDDFKREFKIANQLRHPNLLSINHFDFYDGFPYLILAYCPNGSARKLAGRVDEHTVLKFIAEVSAGLAYLHSRKTPVIHGDIKPDNILIDESGNFLISDFGISHNIFDTSDQPNSGTIAYMPPEAFSKNSYRNDFGSDIWALAMSAYELILGDVLWNGMGGISRLNGSEIPSLPNSFSNELSYLLKSMMSIEPFLRPSAEMVNNSARALLQRSGSPLYNHATTNSENESDRYLRVETTNNISSNNISSKYENKKPILNKTKIRWQRIGIGSLIVVMGILIVQLFIYLNKPSNGEIYRQCKTEEDYADFVKRYPDSPYRPLAERMLTIIRDTISIDSLPIIFKESESDSAKENILEISVAAKQPVITTRKSTNSNLREDEYKEEPRRITTIDKREIERKEFNSCKNRTDYEKYLRKYPKGIYSKEAKKRIREIIDKEMNSSIRYNIPNY